MYVDLFEFRGFPTGSVASEIQGYCQPYLRFEG